MSSRARFIMALEKKPSNFLVIEIILSSFSEFITPYLVKLVKGYRDMGFCVIKYTEMYIVDCCRQVQKKKLLGQFVMR